MSLSFNFKNKLDNLSLMDISKIIIISFVSISLVANFLPYYEGADDKFFGINSIQLSQGQFGITNELMKETGSEIFIPRQWVKTSHDFAIPIGMPSLSSLGALVYSIFGYYGLFYLGPILTIFLLIITERVSTKLFGSFTGFITLIVLAADWKIFQVGIKLMTDNIYAVLVVLGIFFLIKFFKEKNEKFILASTSLFVAATFFRISGVIFFPIEIILLVGFFIINNRIEKKNSKSKNELSSNQIVLKKYIIFYKLKSRKFHKVLIFFSIPWIIFILFWSGFNEYYFADPLTNYETERKFVQPDVKTVPEELTFFEGDEEELIEEIRKDKRKKSVSSFFLFDLERFEWIKFYSVSLMPDNIKFTTTILSSTDTSEDWNAGNWMSVFTFIILISGLLVSLKTKFKRLEVITILLFISGLLWLFSAGFVAPSVEFAPSGGIQERYMITASVLSFIIFGYCVDRFRYFCFPKYSSKPLMKILKPFFIILLIIFLVSLFFIMPPTQDILQSKFSFNDPAEFTKRFPLDLEGLDNTSVIVGEKGRNTVEYGFIHFNPYIDFTRKLGWDINRLEEEPIFMLKSIIENGSKAYAFKENMSPLDEKYFKHLDQNYNLILKDHSKTFCKIELIDNNTKQSSDSVCFSGVDHNPNYGWDVRVKPPWNVFQTP